MRNWKKTDRTAEKTGKHKKTITAEQTQLGRAEGTKRALEEQLEKEIAEAQKRLLLWRKRILRKERVRGERGQKLPG